MTPMPIYDDACFVVWRWAGGVVASTDVEYTDDCRHERRVLEELGCSAATGLRHVPLLSGVGYTLAPMGGYADGIEGELARTTQAFAFCSRRIAR